jgi:lambda repressor-like predicted transcriptional regulator
MTTVSEASVHAAGTVRRVQALAVAGWPLRRVAREAGLSPSALVRLMTAAAVPAATARAVAAVYDRYSTVSPGLCGVALVHARAARARAFAAGWAPVGAWDDDTIDDPAALPDWTGHCGTTRGADLHEKHGIPLCPRCKAALYRRQLRNAARERRALSATRHA